MHDMHAVRRPIQPGQSHPNPFGRGPIAYMHRPVYMHVPLIILAHALAALASGAESAADVPKNYVASVAVIWFGSLAAMVAFTGVILAIASNVIRDPAIHETNKAQKGRLRLE